MNPLFPGINPEPIEPHIELCCKTVVKEKCHAGLATDGDADRIGAVAEDGSFVDSHKCFAVLMRWLLERKKWPGDVVRAFNTTGMVDRIAAKYGRKLHECPIGFKYIADLMMEHDIVIGGEESGGIGYSRYLPERDGILNALLLANVMAEEGKAAGPAGGRSAARIRPSLLWPARSAHSRRREASAIQRARAGTPRPNSAATVVVKKENMDGVKFFLDAPDQRQRRRAWVLLRASGTEPLLRVYSEAATPELVTEILEQAKSLCE